MVRPQGRSGRRAGAQPLTRAPPADALSWVAAAVGRGARVRSVSPFPAATSSAVDAIDVESAGGSLTRLVLRRYVDPAVLVSEPRAVEREAMILQTIETLSIPVPRLIASDPNGSSCGAPALLMTRLAGRTRVRPRSGLDEFIDRLAAPLPVVHATPCPEDPGFPTYHPYSQGHVLEPPK